MPLPTPKKLGGLKGFARVFVARNRYATGARSRPSPMVAIPSSGQALRIRHPVIIGSGTEPHAEPWLRHGFSPLWAAVEMGLAKQIDGRSQFRLRSRVLIFKDLSLNGLIIRSPYIDWILVGKKTWEIRSRYTHVRGRIALIRGGSGLVVGTCELVGVVGPLTLRNLRKNAGKLGRVKSDIRSLPYETTYAWILKNARKFHRPRRYKHPLGAVIWVRLCSV